MKLRRILIVISLCIIFNCIFSINANAVTIVETVNEDDEYDTIENNSIIMGITKFEPNVILTEDKATIALNNNSLYGQNDIGNNVPVIYYFLHNTWYKIDNYNNVSVIKDEHIIDDLNMQNIYYINNVEKILQVDYVEENVEGYNISFESDNQAKDKNISYDNVKLKVPATTSFVKASYIKGDLTSKEELAIIEKESPNSTKFNIKRVEKTSKDGEFKYIVRKPGICQITKYIGNKKEITIPTECDGYKVYAVGNSDAGNFSEERYNIFGKSNLTQNNTITKIVLSEGIEVIEKCAFSGCVNLTEPIVFPKTLKGIEDYAFNNCSSLTGDLNIPEGVVLIGKAAFQNCSSLNGKLILPTSLKNIKAYAFNQCKNLTGDLNLPEGLEEIGRTAFQCCLKLSGDLIIPKDITVLEDYTFNRCSNLKGNLVLPEGLTKIGKTVFQYTGLTGNLNLPNTLVEIGDYAFNQCKGFTGGLIIPNSVKSIGSWTFQKCSNLDGELVLSNSLEIIGDGFMNHCLKITNNTIIFPKTLKQIGSLENDATHTLNNCAINNLKEYKVEEGNEYFKVHDGVLYTKDGVRLIAYPPAKECEIFTIPEGVKKIDELSFSRAGSSVYMEDITKTIKKIIIPNSFEFTTVLPENYLNKGNNFVLGLYKYTGVEEVEVHADNVNYKVIDNVVYSRDGKTVWYTLINFPGKIEILNSVKTIKLGTFFASKDRVNSQKIIIPASVTNIDEDELLEMQILVERNMIEFHKDSIYEIKSDNSIGLK